MRRMQSATTAQYQLQRGATGNAILVQKTAAAALTNSFGCRNPQPDSNGKYRDSEKNEETIASV